MNSAIQLEAMIKRVWRFTWRPGSSDLRDALPDSNRVSLEMHLETMINRECWSAWRQLIWRWLIGKEAQWNLRLYVLVNSNFWECGKLSKTRSAKR